VNDRRNLTAGVVLLLLGIFFLLSRTFHFSGPGTILLLLGTIFLTLSAARGFRGPLLPGGILLGLGAGFLFQRTLDPILPGWATLLAGLGAGFLLVAALDRAAGRERRPAPLVPGLVLVGIASIAALSRFTPVLAVFDRVRDFWPWALVAVGVLLIAQALLRRKA